MKTTLLLCGGTLWASGLLMSPVAAQNETVTRGIDVKGADVKGSDVTGGSVTGGSVTGGSVTGGSVTGGTVTPGTVTPGTVTAVADGRQIQVRAVESVSVNVNGADAEVKIGHRLLLVQRARLVLDGKPLGDLPAAAVKVEVEVKDSQLSVKADGKVVAKTSLK